MNEGDKKLYLERHIAGPDFRLIKFREADQVFSDGRFTFEYQPFESRLSPNFAFFDEGKNDELSMSQNLADLLLARVKEAVATQEKIKNLGIPREQIVLQSGDYAVEISNFTNPLSEETKKEIAEWFRTMLAVSTFDKFPQFENIIMVPRSGEKLHTGDPVNGEYQRELSGILLYPDAFQKKKHRVGGVSHLAGTLTHEYFHQYNTNAGATKLSYDWMQIGGWKWHFKYPQEIAGAEQISLSENLVETEYGRNVSVEEFCDSGVKAIYNRQDFKDPAKRAFFDENFIDVGKRVKPPPVQIIRVDQPKALSFPKKFTFTVMGLARK